VSVYLLSAQNDKHSLNLVELDKYTEIERIRWKVPGVALVIVKDDSVIFRKGFGYADIKKETKVDQHTLFAIASNTKSFTAAAVAGLVDEKKINWDDKVIKYLPYFQMYDPYVTKEMTIRDLLSHRSGLVTFSGDLLWFMTNYTSKEVIERMQYLSPSVGFRNGYGYSNILYSAVGEIISVVTGQKWETYISEKFLKPLKMTRTNMHVSELNNLENVANPYLLKDDTLRNLPYMSWENIAPAASINSSVFDMTKWIKLQLHKGTLDSAQYYSELGSYEMWSPQTILTLPLGSERFWPSTFFRAYGFGWQMMDYQGSKVVFHTGGADGMTSLITLIPQENFGFMVLTNSVSYFPTALMYEILDEFLGNKTRDWSDLYYQYGKFEQREEVNRIKKEEDEHRKDTKPTLQLKDYTGTYGGKLYGNVKVALENDALVLHFLPAPLLAGNLSHWQYDIFKIHLRDVPSLPDGTVQFILDKYGKPVELKIDIPNPDFDFTELELKRID
jgi:CubicO group peptidase (beta-lactamase class C family)